MTFNEVMLHRRIRELETELEEANEDRELLTSLLEAQFSRILTDPDFLIDLSDLSYDGDLWSPSYTVDLSDQTNYPIAW